MEQNTIEHTDTTPYFVTDEIWDHCLDCGRHWAGIIPSCTCNKAYRVRDVSPVIERRVLTKEAKIALGRSILALF